MSGWVKWHRGYADHPCLERIDELGVWGYLLAGAAKESGSVRFRGKVVALEEGQLALSIRELAQAKGIDYARLRRILALFRSHSMIKVDAVHGAHYCIITICNFSVFAQSEHGPRRTNGALEAQTQRTHDADEAQTQRTPEPARKRAPTRGPARVEEDSYIPESYSTSEVIEANPLVLPHVQPAGPDPFAEPEEPQPPRKRAGPQTSRGTRIPPDFEPDLTVAAGIGLHPVKAKMEAEKFLDHWRAKPGKDGFKLDWPATWRNWCRNALDRSGPGGAQLRVVNGGARYDPRLDPAHMSEPG